MKYIRTKKSIREIIEDKGDYCSVKSSHRKAIDNFTIIYGLAFAPRADTIEELCDEIVLHYLDVNRGSIPEIPWATYETRDDRFKNELKRIKEQKIETPNRLEIYGAIWTDKGLIYVAKMNDKGELELL